MHRPLPRLLAALLVILAIVVVSPAVRSQGRKKLLVLTHNAFYVHDMLPTLEQVVPELGKSGGFDVTSLEGYKQSPDHIDLSIVSAKYLEQFDGILMSTNGELPLNDEQRRALVDFVRGGKGFIGIHQVVVTLYTYPPFGELVGGYVLAPFNGVARDSRPITVRVEDRTHPSTRMLPESWAVHDEIYSFAPVGNIGPTKLPTPIGFSRDRVHVLVSIDTAKTDMTNRPKDFKAGGDYPQVWWHDFGKGRAFYTALGHTKEMWTDDPLYRGHVTGGIRWALRLEN